MEPADNNNQTPGTTPDLEKLANELSQASASIPPTEPVAPAPIATPTPTPTSTTPLEPAPISPSPASSTPDIPSPVASTPVTPTPIDSTPVTAPVNPTPTQEPSMAPSSPFTPSQDPTSTPESFTPATDTTSQSVDPFSLDSAPTQPANPLDSSQFATPSPMDSTPLQPAAPAPGSIGSAQSYVAPDPQAQGENAQPKKPKFNRTTILIIILAAVVLIGGIVLAVILITSNSSNNQAVNNGNSSYVPVEEPEEVEPVISSLICTTNSTDEGYIESIGNPSSVSTSIKIDFVDDELSTWTQTTEATYETPEAAASGVAALQGQYDNLLNSYGFVEDPMTSSFSLDRSNLLATHATREDILTLEAATIMGLDTTDITDVADLDLSAENFETIYTGQNYTCAAADEADSEE